MNTLESLTNTKDPFIPLSTLCKEACDTYLGLMRSIKTRHHQLDSEDDDDDTFLLSLQREREERENHFKQLMIDFLKSKGLFDDLSLKKLESGYESSLWSVISPQKGLCYVLKIYDRVCLPVEKVLYQKRLQEQLLPIVKGLQDSLSLACAEGFYSFPSVEHGREKNIDFALLYGCSGYHLSHFCKKVTNPNKDIFDETLKSAYSAIGMLAGASFDFKTETVLVQTDHHLDNYLYDPVQKRFSFLDFDTIQPKKFFVFWDHRFICASENDFAIDGPVYKESEDFWNGFQLALRHHKDIDPHAVIQELKKRRK